MVCDQGAPDNKTNARTGPGDPMNKSVTQAKAGRYFVLLKSGGRFSLNDVIPSRAASVQADWPKAW